MKSVTVKQAHRLSAALLIAGTVIMLMGLFADWILYAGIIVAFSSLIPHFLWNRCPVYRKQLGNTAGDFCQFCGSSPEKE